MHTAIVIEFLPKLMMNDGDVKTKYGNVFNIDKLDN